MASSLIALPLKALRHSLDGFALRLDLPKFAQGAVGSTRKICTRHAFDLHSALFRADYEVILQISTLMFQGLLTLIPWALLGLIFRPARKNERGVARLPFCLVYVYPVFIMGSHLPYS